jgi:hypothetical protein
LPGSLEGSESYAAAIVVKYGVERAHPTITEDPELASNARISNNTAHAGARARGNRPEVESGSREGEGLASNSKGDGREGSRAREGIEAGTDGGGRILRARDLGIERLHPGCRTNDESGTLFIFI